MKKRLLALVFCSIAASHFSHLIADPQEVFGRSFMFTRPASWHLSMNQHLWHSIVHAKHGEALGGIQLTGFYQDSRSRDKIARYFLINCKNELLIAGDMAGASLLNARDVRAEWLNLPNDFSGKMSLNPSQTQVGMMLEYNQHVKRFFDWDFLDNFWVSISAPFIAVTNRTNLTQNNIKNPGDGTTNPRDIAEAFQQNDWCASKIVCERSRFRLAEVQLKLGSAYIAEDQFEIAYYSLFIAPAGNHQNAEFLFDAVVGNNKHVGIGTGVQFQFPLSCHADGFSWNFFADLEGVFLIRNKECRTFDLKGKPWSRFLLMTRENATAPIPGVNLMTMEAIVRPYGFADFSTGLRIRAHQFEFEFGYNLWGHGGETIELRDPNAVFKNPFGIRGTTNANTASLSTIKNLTVNDATFTAIKETDIDLKSAAAGSSLNHKIHASGGIVHVGKIVDAVMGFGVFIDIPQKNGTLKNFGGWAKMGATF